MVRMRRTDSATAALASGVSCAGTCTSTVTVVDLLPPVLGACPNPNNICPVNVYLDASGNAILDEPELHLGGDVLVPVETLRAAGLKIGTRKPETVDGQVYQPLSALRSPRPAG